MDHFARFTFTIFLYYGNYFFRANVYYESNNSDSNNMSVVIQTKTSTLLNTVTPMIVHSLPGAGVAVDCEFVKGTEVWVGVGADCAG